MATPFASKLAEAAINQHQQFKDQHEGDPALAKQIEAYWRDLGFDFPGVDEAWSAVFVSWCVKSAGATKQEFLFNPMHSVFVHRAIQNAIAKTGVFQGFPIGEAKPAIGDILQNNRGGNKFDFAHAQKNESYPSHSAIVVETGEDPKGKYLLTIGGNESDSIRPKEVRLTSDGLVIQRQNGPFICLIKDLKQ